MSKYNKLAMVACAASLATPLFAEGTSSIDLTAASTAATDLATSVSTFFSSSVMPMVVTIGGSAFAVYLVIMLFRWARRPSK